MLVVVICSMNNVNQKEEWKGGMVHDRAGHFRRRRLVGAITLRSRCCRNIPAE